ncbi:MAG: hypothetical protein BGO07_04960 [Alphaproteobacteria bacterium 40-19]|mgnify:CR=1 FL=1|nr:MAG: hypothetical protein BGO07_04960 [Alphaproteobacteria bacterium 40-19]
MKKIFLLLLIALNSPKSYTLPLKTNPQEIVFDSEAYDFITDLCRPILKFLPAKTLLQFYFINSPEINAFATTQHVFINTGLFQSLDLNSLVGILVHELGHIAGKHVLQFQEALKKAQTKGLVSTILGLLVMTAGALGKGSSSTMGAGGGLQYLGEVFALHDIHHFSRSQEGAADQFALKVLRSLNWPLSGFMNVMEDFAKKESLYKNEHMPYLRTHPFSQDRLESARRALEFANPKTPTCLPAPILDKFYRVKIKFIAFTSPVESATDSVQQACVPPEYKSYGKAIAMYRQGSLQEALSELESFEKNCSQNAFTLELRSQILFDLNQAEKAWQAIGLACKMRPRDALIQAQKAIVSLQTDKQTHIQESIRCLQRLTHAPSPQTGSLWYWLAVAFGKTNQPGKMQVALAEYALYKGELPRVQQHVRLALKLLKPQDPYYHKAKDLEHLLKSNPPSSFQGEH